MNITTTKKTKQTRLKYAYIKLVEQTKPLKLKEKKTAMPRWCSEISIFLKLMQKFWRYHLHKILEIRSFKGEQNDHMDELKIAKDFKFTLELSNEPNVNEFKSNISIASGRLEMTPCFPLFNKAIINPKVFAKISTDGFRNFFSKELLKLVTIRSIEWEKMRYHFLAFFFYYEVRVFLSRSCLIIKVPSKSSGLKSVVSIFTSHISQLR